MNMRNKCKKKIDIFNVGAVLIAIILCMNFYTSTYLGESVMSWSSFYKNDSEQKTIAFKDGDYSLEVDSVILEGEKLIITGSVEGPELKYIEVEETGAEIEIVPKDFDEESIAACAENKIYCEGDTYKFRIEENYNEGTVNKFIQSKQKYLLLDIMIYKRSDLAGKSIDIAEEKNTEDERDYRVYWRGNDTVIKEFKGIKVHFNLE